MKKLDGERNGYRDIWGNPYFDAEDGYEYIEDEYGNLYPTNATIKAKKKEEEKKRQREAQPGFFDDLPTFDSLLSKNIAEEKQRRAMKKAQREQKFNATMNTAVNVGGILFSAAKAAGHTNAKTQQPVMSDKEYDDLIDELYD